MRKCQKGCRKMRLEEAIDHLKDRLKYCVSSAAVGKSVIELSVESLETLKQIIEPKPLEDWGEDFGDCLWWSFPIEEPPYCGSPLDCDFPDYVTHFTRFIVPDESEDD